MKFRADEDSPMAHEMKPDSFLLPIEANTAQIFELGWQSWSPSATYSATSTSPRPKRDIWQTMAFRPGFFDESSRGQFISDGWLIVDPGDGTPILSFEGTELPNQVPHITAKVIDNPSFSKYTSFTHLGRKVDTIPGSSALLIEADSDIEVRAWPTLTSIPAVLNAISCQYALRIGTPFKTEIDPAWCSWYCYWTNVIATDITSEVAKIAERNLNVKTIQIDDGWQIDLGTWRPSSKFGDLDATIKAVTEAGYEVGIWVAPFLIGEKSRVVLDNPNYIATNQSAGFNWQQNLLVANLANESVRNSIFDTFKFLADKGISYYKLDFLYAGLISDDRSTTLYRDVLAGIREVIGEQATLVGCGAPILPSVGLFDAMRVSPDIAPHWNPPLQDVSQPGSRAAIANARNRAPLHGNLWINDHDCALTRPSIMARELIASAMEANGGLRTFSDPIDTLDEWAFSRLGDLLQTSNASQSGTAAALDLSYTDYNASTATIFDHENSNTKP